MKHKCLEFLIYSKSEGKLQSPYVKVEMEILVLSGQNPERTHDLG